MSLAMVVLYAAMGMLFISMPKMAMIYGNTIMSFIMAGRRSVIKPMVLVSTLTIRDARSTINVQRFVAALIAVTLFKIHHDQHYGAMNGMDFFQPPF